MLLLHEQSNEVQVDTPAATEVCTGGGGSSSSQQQVIFLCLSMSFIILLISICNIVFNVLHVHEQSDEGQVDTPGGGGRSGSQEEQVILSVSCR